MAEKVVDLSLAKWGKTRTDGSADWRRKQNRRMRHHSRMVVSLKVLLPSLAALLIGLVILWPQLLARQDEAISIISETDAAPQDQMMVNPRFFTVDGKGEPLNMTAENAYELPGETRRIRLNNVKADIVLKDNRFLALDAAAAVYFQSKDLVELSESVNLYSEDGFELNTTQAQIGLKDQNLTGTEETFVRTPMGTAVSDGFEIRDGGTVVRLTGKTKVVFYPDRKDEE